MPLSQFPNKLVMFLGGTKPKVMYIMRQTTFERAIKEKVLNEFLAITKTTSFRPYPIALD
jgi:hypothetical protein